MSTKKTRVRFAPSPTGPLHIGGVRTALFNYLFAKKNNGDFILRIEDTDQARFVEGAEEYIINSLEWCGIKFDEGIKEGGEYGPYRQSERKMIYHQYADALIVSGNAYYAFDTPEELNDIRKQYETEKKTFAYDSSVRDKLNNSIILSEKETYKLINSETPYVIRFKMPVNEELILNDIIRGEIKINTSTLDDKILFKSDGMPTYHLANIVDDHLMEISHVIRGEEWLPSLPLHVLLYKAFLWEKEMPEFAHLPLLLKPVGNGKLSKRDGDKLGFPVFPLYWKSPSGEEFRGYREDGYFADAFINMLVFLGWNPGGEKEIFSMNELIEAFTFERVGKSGSKFDPEKAKWFNNQYIQTKDNSELAKLFIPILKQKGIDAEILHVTKIVGLVKERVSFVNELWEQSYFFFNAPTEYDQKVIKKKWKENTPEILTGVKEMLSTITVFEKDNIEPEFKAYLEKNEIGFGQVMNALRLTLVGNNSGPDLFTIISLIGKQETINRIETGINLIAY